MVYFFFTSIKGTVSFFFDFFVSGSIFLKFAQHMWNWRANFFASCEFFVFFTVFFVRPIFENTCFYFASSSNPTSFSVTELQTWNLHNEQIKTVSRGLRFVLFRNFTQNSQNVVENWYRNKGKKSWKCVISSPFPINCV